MVKFEGFSTKEQYRLETILNNFNSNFIKEIFKKIINDHELMNDDKYATFGKYNIQKGILKLNPRVFIVEDYDDGKKTMSKLSFIVLHEIGHVLDKKFKYSSKKDWLNLSGWVEDPIVKKGKINLIIPKESGEVRSQWYHDKNAKFVRWYSEFGPAEDLTDSFSFYVGGLLNRIPKEKKDYIGKIYSELKVKGII
jgi:hypothetical protein